ncbi:MAG: prepilin-type N-terminal cleavage/methylation domain-containing protein [Clostridiales bacterium]|nr:prepilin-type N-terminal cleavage/methylation domain-containing protein [Clostridiales bacterium]
MRKRLGRKGMTILELLVTMAVLSLLGAMVLGLVGAGRRSSTRIQTDIADDTEARTAMSLITVSIRQHDATGAIELVNVGAQTERLKLRANPFAISAEEREKGKVILFREGDDGMCTIYAVDRTGEGQSVSDPVDVMPLADIEPIAVVRSVRITEDIVDNSLVYNIVITYGAGGREKTLEQSVTLRSAIAST